MTHNSKYSVDILKQHLTLLCGNPVRRRNTTVAANKPTYLEVYKVFKLNVNYIDGLSNNIEITKTFVTSYL